MVQHEEKKGKGDGDPHKRELRFIQCLQFLVRTIFYIVIIRLANIKPYIRYILYSVCNVTTA